MNDQVYGREVVTPRTAASTATARPMDVVPAGSRTSAVPDVGHELPAGDRLADVIDRIGKAVGRVTGYVRSRPGAGMRADAETLISGRPLVVLGAAIGLGYLVGRQLRR